MMNLKDKKITRCHYVDSKGKTYYVGYGDDLSPEISFTLKTRQVSFFIFTCQQYNSFFKGISKNTLSLTYSFYVVNVYLWISNNDSKQLSSISYWFVH